MVLGLFIISCDSQEKREAIEDCGEDPSVLNAKTNAAAKLAFKSCMIGMGF